MRPALGDHGLRLPADETARCLRDLVALSTLPSLWREPAPQAIAASLASALFSALRADHVRVVLHQPGGSLVCTEPTHRPGPPEALAPHVTPIGIEGEKGRIDVWSRGALRTTDELLLNVAANQAAVWLAHAWLARRDRESSERMSRLFEGITDAFFAVDHRWRITYHNSRAHGMFAELLGPRESFVGAHLWDLFPTAGQRPFYEAYVAAMETGETRHVEGYYAPADRWFAATAYPTPEGLSIFNADVTARKRDEARLQALSRLGIEAGTAPTLAATYEAAFRAIDAAMGAQRASILLFDDDGVMRFKAWRGLSDEYRADLEGHTPWKPGQRDAEPIIIHDASTDPGLAAYGDLFAREGIRTLAFFPLAHEGRVIGKFMTYHERPSAFTAAEIRAGHGIASTIAIAITRRRAEEDAARARLAMARSDKLAALGMLVSGVAHEIRTPLTIIENNTHVLEAQLARHPAGAGAQVIASLDEIRGGVARASDLVAQLKRYTKLESNQRVALDVNKACEEALRLLEAARRAPVHVHTRLRAERTIRGDPAQIQQVVINLVANALDATAGDPAQVKLEARDVEGSVELIVEDEGCGMDADAQARLFQPLYTTKSHGTGLGLSIVKRIIDEHAATIRCESRPGHGTRFTLRFRASDEISP